MYIYNLLYIPMMSLKLYATLYFYFADCLKPLDFCRRDYENARLPFLKYQYEKNLE